MKLACQGLDSSYLRVYFDVLYNPLWLEGNINDVDVMKVVVNF